MADLSKLTMITPVLERHPNIPIFMKYHKDWNCKKIIADSSQQEYTGPIDDDFRYMYYGPTVFFNKIYDILCRCVTTDYVFVTSDDDIAIPSSVEKCINFLDQDKSCVFCHGEWYWYERGGIIPNRNLTPGYVTHLNNPCFSSDPIERIVHFFLCYYPTVNAIVRTDIMRNVFSHLIDKKFHISSFGDRAFPLFALLYGSWRVLDIPFIVQKYNDRVWGSKKHGQRLIDGIYKNVHISVEDTLTDAGLTPFAVDLAQELKMSQDEALKFLKDVLIDHYANERKNCKCESTHNFKITRPEYVTDYQKIMAFMREVDRNLVRDGQNL